MLVHGGLMCLEFAGQADAGGAITDGARSTEVWAYALVAHEVLLWYVAELSMMRSSEAGMIEFVVMRSLPAAQAATLLSWASHLGRVGWAACGVQVLVCPVHGLISGMLPPGFLGVASSFCSTRPWLCMLLVVNLGNLSGTKNPILSILIEHAAWCSRSNLSRSLVFTRAIICATQLCQGAIIHFLTLFHHLHYIALCCIHQIGLSCCEPCSCRRNLICKILITNTKIVFGNCLGVSFPSLGALGTSTTLTLTATIELLWSFAWAWWRTYLPKVSITATSQAIDGRILLVRLTAWLRYLVFQANLPWNRIIHQLLLQRTIHSILPFQRVHLVKSILDLFILLSAHVLCIALSWCQLQIEIDSLAKLVDVYCVLAWLIYVGCACDEAIVAWTRAHRCARNSSCW